MSNHVAILMGTFNGDRFLSEQLKSINAQTHTDWSLWVSDDGSSDGTERLIEQFKKDCPRSTHLLSGPRQGFIRNFLTLICHPSIEAEFYCFADQDDIWHPDKLERALDWHQRQDSRTPSLYCARTRTVDEDGSSAGFSPLFKRPPTLSNALVQSIAGGNTMVMNRAARNVLRAAGANVEIASHDWWAYLLLTAAGGIVHYDPVPPVDYRQHDSNLVGSNTGLKASFRRLRMMTRSRFRTWNEMHLNALQSVGPSLSIESHAIIDQFHRVRNGDFFERLWLLYRSNLRRQTLLGNIGLFIAVALKQI
ncbi:glycosyltransferase family 2 protein [Rhizobium sp. 2YAF20]|uniref:glycosyltransferase family 2 protein n=1 Tax=Rhizobium sp. 2YAF20 TaxID=3233027 RepID=UPI003F9E25C7